MDCELAREALSARIDGEREPVPSARVDEHVRSCPKCTEWYANAQQHASALQRLAGAMTPPAPGADTPGTTESEHRWASRYGLRVALGLAGAALLGIAVAQAVGRDFGMVPAHGGAQGGAHLLNETTAWCAALGVASIAAAFRPLITLGLAWVLFGYTAVLGYYVVVDAIAGHVTAARIASHVPVAVAAVLAVLVWRRDGRGDPSPRTQLHRAEGTVPLDPSMWRHLRPTDDSAA